LADPQKRSFHQQQRNHLSHALGGNLQHGMNSRQWTATSGVQRRPERFKDLEEKVSSRIGPLARSTWDYESISFAVTSNTVLVPITDAGSQ